MEAKIVPYLFLNNISSEMNPFYYFRYIVTCFKAELENVPLGGIQTINHFVGKLTTVPFEPLLSGTRSL